MFLAQGNLEDHAVRFAAKTTPDWGSRRGPEAARLAIVAFILAVSPLSGCAVGPDFVVPEAPAGGGLCGGQTLKRHAIGSRGGRRLATTGDGTRRSGRMVETVSFEADFRAGRGGRSKPSRRRRRRSRAATGARGDRGRRGVAPAPGVFDQQRHPPTGIGRGIWRDCRVVIVHEPSSSRARRSSTRFTTPMSVSPSRPTCSARPRDGRGRRGRRRATAFPARGDLSHAHRQCRLRGDCRRFLRRANQGHARSHRRLSSAARSRFRSASISAPSA